MRKRHMNGIAIQPMTKSNASPPFTFALNIGTEPRLYKSKPAPDKIEHNAHRIQSAGGLARLQTVKLRIGSNAISSINIKRPTLPLY